MSGLIAVFALFQWTATALGSDRGQAGVIVGVIVVAAAIFAGNSIWAPAIIHFVAQAAIKVPVVSGESAWLFPLFRIAVCAVIPIFLYVVPNPVKRTENLFTKELTTDTVW